MNKIANHKLFYRATALHFYGSVGTSLELWKLTYRLNELYTKKSVE